MSIVLQSSGGGSVTINEPTTASNFTQTLPVATGTVMVSGNMPAFSAYANASQSITSNVVTKVIFQAEDFDTANCFDSTTNYRFTPIVAGYYQINAQVRYNGTSLTAYDLLLYKNGSLYQNMFASNAGLNTAILSGSCVVYLNGSTDYVEIYADSVGISPTLSATGSPGNSSRFSGALIRTA